MNNLAEYKTAKAVISLMARGDLHQKVWELEERAAIQARDLKINSLEHQIKVRGYQDQVNELTQKVGSLKNELKEVKAELKRETEGEGPF